MGLSCFPQALTARMETLRILNAPLHGMLRDLINRSMRWIGKARPALQQVGTQNTYALLSQISSLNAEAWHLRGSVTFPRMPVALNPESNSFSFVSHYKS